MASNPEMPTWWPLKFESKQDVPVLEASVGEPAFATAKDVSQAKSRGDDNPYRVWDRPPGLGGEQTNCDNLLEVLAVLIEIAKRKAPHTLPPSYLSE